MILRKRTMIPLLCVGMLLSGSSPVSVQEVRLLDPVIEEVGSNEQSGTDLTEIINSVSEGMPDLKAQIETEISTFEGDWSVYVCALGNEEYLSVNSHPVKSASIIKLFIMGAVLEQVENGTMTEDETVDTLLWNMITVSDNESSNELVRRLSPDGTNHSDGMTVVNGFCEEHGYTDTSQGRDMLDFRATPAPGENYTSVSDCGKFLKDLYQGTLITEERCEQMLNLLKNQQRTWKIPSGLPEGTETANKTGELSDTENDCAIVFSPNQDYILCIFSVGVPDTAAAQSRIRQISGMVYDYFNA